MICPNCSNQVLVMANLISCRHCGFYADNKNENISNPIIGEESAK